jgi:chromosome segregation ATPase
MGSTSRLRQSLAGDEFTESLDFLNNTLDSVASSRYWTWMPLSPRVQQDEAAELRARVATLESALNTEGARADAAVADRERLRAAYQQLQIELELLRRRIFVAKSEQQNSAQLELDFAVLKKQLDELHAQLTPETPAPETEPNSKPPPKERAKPT